MRQFAEDNRKMSLLKKISLELKLHLETLISDIY